MKRKAFAGQIQFDWEAIYAAPLHEGHSGSIDILPQVHEVNAVAHCGRAETVLQDLLPVASGEGSGDREAAREHAGKAVLDAEGHRYWVAFSSEMVIHIMKKACDDPERAKEYSGIADTWKQFLLKHERMAQA